MKKITILIIGLTLSLLSFAASPEYHEAMLANLKNLDTTQKAENFIALAGIFEQISNVEKDEWLPQYYAAFCYLNASLNEKDEDKKDILADKSISISEGLSSLRPTDSEVCCLLAFANIAKFSAKPMTRYMTYVSKINELLAKSSSLNPNNPRPLFLMGTMTYNTPEFAGGGKEKAMPKLKEAFEKFNKFTPETDLSPNWGKAGCEFYINKN